MLNSPKVIRRRSDLEHCTFNIFIGQNPDIDLNVESKKLFANVPTSTEDARGRWSSYPVHKRGWCAVRSTLDRTWFLADSVIAVPNNGVYLVIDAHTPDGGCDEIATFVDPKMKAKDINGARIAYKNEKGDKMLFAHCELDEHHDRMLQAETAISTVFEELLHDKLTTLLVSFIHEHSTSNQIGEAAILEHIELFRDDCKKLARYNEGQLYVGQHLQEPGKYYIYQMVENAFNDCEKKWKKEKPAEFNVISDHIASIRKRLNSRHTFKRRWETIVFPEAGREPESETEENNDG